MIRALAIIALLLAAWACIAAAKADPPPGTDLNSPRHKWFAAQHSVSGAWCCDVSDGHILHDDEWRMSLIPTGENSGYEVQINGAWFPIPNHAMRDPNGGPNPTGQAIVWYVVNDYGVQIYCFAPGWQG